MSRTSGGGGGIGGGQTGEKFSIESILGKVCTHIHTRKNNSRSVLVNLQVCLVSVTPPSP